MPRKNQEEREQHGRLVEQLRLLPIGLHDDGPDALEIVLRMAEFTEPERYDMGVIEYASQFEQEGIHR